MSDLEKILVLGATGNIGFTVVQKLTENGIAVRAGVSNPEKSKTLWADNALVDVIHFDFLDTATFPSALEGITKVFFVRPPQLSKPKEDMFPFLRFLKERSVAHVVFVSLIGVEKNPVTPHHKIEKEMVRLALPYTFLRPSFFMQNLNATHQEDIQKHSDLFIPAGKAKTSFIDTRDIGEIAAICLMNTPDHLHQKYSITGKEAVSYDEVADRMTAILGKKITYSKPSLRYFRSTMIKRGIPKEYANVMTMLYFITQMGNAKKVTVTANELLKRELTSIDQYIADYRTSFL
ncbi:SDR family oxidoreductase [Paenilisteria newyorkensis]|uniref:SDR family oxidoreductase n=1 Tax=Listeria newyorkensis TaxID=1497681 RepID=UPI000740E779|nr:SDR family oxidoreductase [Listeria newyorkensis]